MRTSSGRCALRRVSGPRRRNVPWLFLFALRQRLCLLLAEFVHGFVIAVAAAIEHERNEAAANYQGEERSEAKGDPALLAYHHAAGRGPRRYGQDAHADQQRYKNRYNDALANTDALHVRPLAPRD